MSTNGLRALADPAAPRSSVAQAILALGAAQSAARLAQVVAREARALVRARSALLLSADRGDATPVVRGLSGRLGDIGLGAPIGLDPAAASEPAAALRRAGLSVRHALVAPLPPVHGLLVVIDRRDGRPFDRHDAERLELLAAAATTALSIRAAADTDDASASIEAADRERHWWTRELHDETLQGMIALQVMLSTAVRHGADAELRDMIAVSQQHLRDEITNLRNLISTRRPAVIDMLGFAGSIEWIAIRTGELSELDVRGSVDLGPGWDALAPERASELELVLYRTVQEACSNVVKHARARGVRLRVWTRGAVVHAEVTDDGAGFAPDAVDAGSGLLGMRERAELVGGRVEIGSAPGAGTRVHVTIPLEREAHPSASRSSSTMPLPSA